MEDGWHKVVKRHGLSVSSKQSLCAVHTLELSVGLGPVETRSADRRRTDFDNVSRSREDRRHHKAQTRKAFHSLDALCALLVTNQPASYSHLALIIHS